MKTRLRGLEWVMLAALAGCGDHSRPIEPVVTEVSEIVEAPDSPSEGIQSEPGGSWLLSPPDGAAIPQNVASLDCAANPYRGYGLELRFDWKDAVQADGEPTYEIVVKNRGAAYPVVHTRTTLSKFEETHCNAFVIDRNLLGWEWGVTAFSGPGDVLWSEVREFRFEPCRHADDVPCTAPVGS